MLDLHGQTTQRADRRSSARKYATPHVLRWGFRYYSDCADSSEPPPPSSSPSCSESFIHTWSLTYLLAANHSLTHSYSGVLISRFAHAQTYSYSDSFILRLIHILSHIRTLSESFMLVLARTHMHSIHSHSHPYSMAFILIHIRPCTHIRSHSYSLSRL